MFEISNTFNNTGSLTKDNMDFYGSDVELSQ